jgi:hypothetical protein
MTPSELLERGVAELAPVMTAAGFVFVGMDTRDDESGVPSARGEFQKGDRRLELQVRRSLNEVRYHFGEDVLTHDDLVRGAGAVDRIAGEAQYPGFSEDPMAGFRHLRADIEKFGATFLKGGAKAFRALKKWVDKHPKKSGIAGLGR